MKESKIIICKLEYGDRRLQGVYDPLEKKGIFNEIQYYNKKDKLFLYKISFFFINCFS